MLGLVLLPVRLVFILVSLALATGLARLGLLGLSEEERQAGPFTGWRLYIRYVS